MHSTLHYSEEIGDWRSKFGAQNKESYYDQAIFKQSLNIISLPLVEQCRKQDAHFLQWNNNELITEPQPVSRSVGRDLRITKAVRYPTLSLAVIWRNKFRAGPASKLSTECVAASAPHLVYALRCPNSHSSSSTARLTYTCNGVDLESCTAGEEPNIVLSSAQRTLPTRVM